jgi:peptidoglycan glycosyltransferase
MIEEPREERPRERLIRARARTFRVLWGAAALVLVLVGAAWVLRLAGSAGPAAVNRAAELLSPAPPPEPPTPTSLGLASFDPKPAPDGRLEQRVGDRRFVYTLVPSLQKEAERVLSQYKVPYGAIVAMEPATGRILAMAEYSQAEPLAEGLLLRATYPAASLAKVVTAAAALSTGKVTPSTVYRYEGSPYKLSERKLSPRNARREGNITTLTQALGKSNNVVFAKVGADVVGPGGLAQAFDSFFFNRPIPFDLPLAPSSATVPCERYPLACTSAGFGDVHLSPIHAALIAATVANGGLAMRPFVVDEVTDASGAPLYRAVPEELGRAVEPRIASVLADMMRSTVENGTSTRTFRRYAKNLYRRVDIAGKTGTLDGDNPEGRYEWFIGFAPAENPKIAVAGLVVNQGDIWYINGTFTAAAVMKRHFGM